MAASGATCQCSNLFKDPRMLPCLHTFCLQCLTKACEIQGAKESLKCPSCDEKVSLPEGGIESLPVDLRKAHEAEIAGYGKKLETGKEACGVCFRSGSGPAIVFCVNCCEFLCKVCDEHHRSARKTHKHEIVTVDTTLVSKEEKGEHGLAEKCQEPRMPCPTHDDEILKFYCEKCDKLICRDCMELDHNDHRSQCNRVEAIAAKAMDCLLSEAGECQGIIASLNTSISQCKAAIQKVKSRKREADDVIVKSLNHVRDALLAQCEAIHLGKLTGLKMQICELEKLCENISHVSNKITVAMSHSPSQQLSTRKIISDRLTQVLQCYRSVSSLPLQSALFVTKIADEDKIHECIALGQVSGGSDPASSTCDVTFVPRAVVGKERIIKVTACNSDGSCFLHGVETVTAELALMGSEKSVIQCNITDHGDGTHSITFTAQSTGVHEFQVTIGGHPIKGSPFTITIRPPTPPYDARSFHKAFSTYANCKGIAFGENGMVAVTEYSYHTVSLFSKDGSRMHTFGVGGKSSNSRNYFCGPEDVAIKDDVMYVTDSGNNRVQKIRMSDKTYVTSFGSNGKGNGQFSNPRGICIHPDGRLFIADYSNHRIQVHQPDGTFVSSIMGDPQNEESKFQRPWGLTFDPQGRLHIAAYGSNCIKVYTPEGNYIKTYGSGTLNYPAGIAIDEEGYIAISECGGSNRIWIYNPDHTQLVKTIQSGLSILTGMTCDADGMFWVAEDGNSRVHKF